jgi:hypothetical protein
MLFSVRSFLRASDDGHSGLGLIANHIEILLHRTQIIREAFDVLVKADEIEIAVTLEPRNLLHVGGRPLLEILGIGGFSGLAAQRSIKAEHPAVVEALK